MKLPFMKLDPRAKAPVYGTAGAAGADLCCLSEDGSDILIPAGKTVFLHTGLAVAIPEGTVGLVYARSGLACKKDLAPANKVGVIDSDYRGEIMIAMHNHGTEERTLSSGERVAQLVVTPILTPEPEEVISLPETVRGAGGFGSTGR